MTDRILDRIRADNAAWWEAHPKLKQDPPSGTADGLARSVVHWHHNVESAKRDDQPRVAGDEYFLRQYAIFATEAWLRESQAELDTCTDWSRKRDLECLVRDLQIALNNFEWNSKNQRHP